MVFNPQTLFQSRKGYMGISALGRAIQMVRSSDHLRIVLQRAVLNHAVNSDASTARPWPLITRGWRRGES